MELVNLSPYSAEHACVMNHEAAEVAVIVVKGTFTIENNRALSLSEHQLPVNKVPVYQGDPGSSSLLHETDFAFEKKGTDCVLMGHAYAQRPGDRQVGVMFGIGPVQKTAFVFGDRQWVRSGAHLAISDPAPFEKIPLNYELAFGGRDESSEDSGRHEFCEWNPVGRGFRAAHSKLPLEGTLLPNIEDPRQLMRDPRQRPEPAGFGFVAPWWQPRQRYAGTYDAKWQENLAPLLPEDFDPRFFSAGSPGLVSQAPLRGDEEVVVQNACPGGRIHLQLPAIRPRISARIGLSVRELPTNLDTVIVEPDERRLQLVWRSTLNLHQRMTDVRWIGIKNGRIS